jgi:hypothetical protein
VFEWHRLQGEAAWAQQNPQAEACATEAGIASCPMHSASGVRLSPAPPVFSVLVREVEMGKNIVDPLWAVLSGKFVGWRNGDRLHDADGNNVGKFTGNVAFSLDGNYIGEMYGNDRIGKRSTASYAGKIGTVGTIGIAIARMADRPGMGVAGWEDPDF